MSKFKIGDEFQIPVKIVDADVTDDVYLIEDEHTEISVWLTGQELQKITDPNYSERQRLLRIEELKKELQELGGY